MLPCTAVNSESNAARENLRAKQTGLPGQGPSTKESSCCTDTENGVARRDEIDWAPPARTRKQRDIAVEWCYCTPGHLQ